MLGAVDHAGRSVGLDIVAQRVRVRNLFAGGGGQKPEQMPGLRARLDGSVPVVAGVVLGMSISHLGSQYCVNAETHEDIALGAQTVAGVTAHRSWTRGGRGFRSLRFLVGADNLLDAAVYEQCGLPRAGRTVRAGFEIR